MPTNCWSSSRMEMMSRVENLVFILRPSQVSESKIKGMMILITIKFGG